jgi:hypothetical protein
MSLTHLFARQYTFSTDGTTFVKILEEMKARNIRVVAYHTSRDTNGLWNVNFVSFSMSLGGVAAVLEHLLASYVTSSVSCIIAEDGPEAALAKVIPMVTEAGIVVYSSYITSAGEIILHTDNPTKVGSLIK